MYLNYSVSPLSPFASASIFLKVRKRKRTVKAIALLVTTKMMAIKRSMRKEEEKGASKEEEEKAKLGQG
jgi:hypothetical protein